MTRPPFIPRGARPAVSRGLASLLFGTAYGFALGCAAGWIVKGLVS